MFPFLIFSGILKGSIMPQNYTSQSSITRDFSFLDSSEKNHEFYSGHCGLGFDVPIHGVSAGYRLVHVAQSPDRFLVLMLCDSTQEVVYYIDCRVYGDKYLEYTSPTQVMLWRSMAPRHERAVSGIARTVFLDYLLKSYSIMASDSCQTREGRSFWVRQMLFAMDAGLHVYRYDRLNCVLKEVLTEDEVTTNSADLWGDDESYQNILAVITPQSLK